MKCDEPRVLMHGHLDGELELAADLEIQRHLEECPQCAGEYAAMRAMRTRLRDEGFRFEAPQALKEKIHRAIPVSSSTPARWAPVRAGGYPSRRGTWVPRAVRFAVPMAIGVMLALMIAPRMIGPSLDQRLASEVVASHVRSLMGAHLMDVVSTNQHTVKPWFDGKLDFSPPVTDFAKDGFPLVGGRLDYIDGRAVAALVYQHGKHVINVFMWPTANSVMSGESIKTEHGYNVEHSMIVGMNCWAVSDLNHDELDKFAGLLRASSGS